MLAPLSLQASGADLGYQIWVLSGECDTYVTLFLLQTVIRICLLLGSVSINKVGTTGYAYNLKWPSDKYAKMDFCIFCTFYCTLLHIFVAYFLIIDLILSSYFYIYLHFFLQISTLTYFAYLVHIIHIWYMSIKVPIHQALRLQQQIRVNPSLLVNTLGSTQVRRRRGWLTKAASGSLQRARSGPLVGQRARPGPWDAGLAPSLHHDISDPIHSFSTAQLLLPSHPEMSSR